MMTSFMTSAWIEPNGAASSPRRFSNAAMKAGSPAGLDAKAFARWGIRGRFPARTLLTATA